MVISIPCKYFASRPEKYGSRLSQSSKLWLQRQHKDPYVLKAKESSYRARSAFKLIEIDDKFQILRAGMTVLDCGAAPGSWSQVLVERVNSLHQNSRKAVGTVISVDRDHMAPLKGATVISMADITSAESRAKILAALRRPRPVDFVLSDMAPNASGSKALDQERIMELQCSLLKFSLGELLKAHGGFLIKLWNGPGTRGLVRDLEPLFESVKIVKPSASREDSAEIYVLARNYQWND